jgi:hypothetical protein
MRNVSKVTGNSRRCLAMLLVAVLALSLSVFASGPMATYASDQDNTEPDDPIVTTRVYAQAAENYVRDDDLVERVIVRPGRSDQHLRANVNNALGAPDSPQNAPDDTFTSLAFFPKGISYFFGPEDADGEHVRIYRNPDREVRHVDRDGFDDEDPADLSLVEVTWNPLGWHVESAQVLLINPLFVGGEAPEPGKVVIGESGHSYYPIGIAWNRAAAVQNLGNIDREFQRFHNEGDITRTDIFFPNYIISSEGVRLVHNESIGVSPANAPCDGYDLDALMAWNFKSTEVEWQDLYFMKDIRVGEELFHPDDYNEFEWDIFTEYGVHIYGPLTTTDGTNGRVIIPREVLADLEPGIYHVIERELSGWLDLTGRIRFEVTEEGVDWVYEGYRVYVNAPLVMLRDLNWNNGNISNRNGANGGGINAFSIEGVTLRNNRNYLTPDNFEEALINPANQPAAIYTVVERTVIEGEVYTKVHVVRVALMGEQGWRLFEGTITVDNPGGNNNRQQIAVIQVR